MARKYHTAEQIIGKLRQAEVILGQGGDLDKALREIAVTKNTYYRWRQEYGGLKLDQAKRMKELEAENARLDPPPIIRSRFRLAVNQNHGDDEGGNHGKTEAQPGADYSAFKAGRCTGLAGQDSGDDLPRDQRIGRDVLQVAQGVRRHGHGSGATAQRA